MVEKPQSQKNDDPKVLRKAIDEVAELSASVSEQLETLQQKIKAINDIADW